MKKVLVLCCICFSIAGGVQAADTFKVEKRLLKVGNNPCAIAVADLNEDDWPEIITADRGILRDPREERPANDELSLLKAQGNLEYVKHHPSLRSGFGPYAIAIANIDALKWPDILVAGFHAVKHRDLALYRNLKTENLFASEMFSVSDDAVQYFRHRDGDNHPLYVKPGLSSLAVRDFDGDGLRDAIATAWSSDALILFPGHAETYFSEPVIIPAVGGPRDVQLGDFNGDKHTDLAVACYVSGEIALWEGVGDGTFTPANRFPARGRMPVRLRVADMNNDKKLDIVVVHRHVEDMAAIFYGDGDFEFGVSQELVFGEDRAVLEKDLRDLVVADFNGDGKKDLAMTAHASREVLVLINTTKEGSARQRFKEEQYAFEEARPFALSAADLDQDSHPDLAVTLWEKDAVALLINQAKD